MYLIFRFWTIGQTKKRQLKMSPWTWGNCEGLFFFFTIFNSLCHKYLLINNSKTDSHRKKTYSGIIGFCVSQEIDTVYVHSCILSEVANECVTSSSDFSSKLKGRSTVSLCRVCPPLSAAPIPISPTPVVKFQKL